MFLFVVMVHAQPSQNVEAGSNTGGLGTDVRQDSALAIRQERVRRLMMEIPPRMLDLARSLETTEPQRAKRLQEAIVKLQQLRMDQQMAEAARLLAQEKLESAGSRQTQIIGQIEEVIGLLLAEDAYVDPAVAEAAQLEAWRKELEQLIGEQQRVQREVRLQLEKEKVLSELAEQARRAEAILGKQKELRRQTGIARQGGAGAVEGLADAQKALAGETRGVMEEVGRMMAAGQAGFKEAVWEQEQASEQLAGGRGAGAQASQDKAIEALSRAVKELREERGRIERLPKERFDSQAKQQEAIEKQAGELGRSMRGESGEVQGESQGQGQQVGPGAQAGKQGAAAVQKAQKAMQRAGGDLRNKQGESATKAQAEAEEELEAARQAVEERLQQLRKQMMEERLAGLEARFRLMLDRQKPVTAGTRELAVVKPADWSRAQVLQCAGLARRQMDNHELAQQCMDVLADDGTTVVFPQIVEQLQGDMVVAGRWLEGQQADEATIGLQEEMEATLMELLAAVQSAQKHLEQMNQAQGQGQQGGQGMEALAPPSAELKLLRAAQLRVNEGTAAAAKIDEVEGVRDGRRKEVMERLAKRQIQLRDWAAKVAEGQ